MLLRSLLILSLCSVVSGCFIGVSANQASGSQEDKIWVFAEFNVPIEDERGEVEIDFLYYFGKIERSTYERITNNELSNGFLKVEDVHYWNDDNEVEEYADELYNGNLVFKIEYISLVRELSVKHPKEFKIPDDLPEVDEKSI